MNELKACGIIICALIVCVVFKNLKSEYSLFIRIIITISVFSVSLGLIYPILNYISEIAKGTAIDTYLPILLKSMGIAFTVQITSDVCKDAGEGALAERVIFFGKSEILVISLPLVKSLFSLCEDLLK